MKKPKKLAVVGGGMSSMTAIYYLTSQPNWQEEWDITVYQMGWRIGGKGASGVNPKKGYRIEEHGLHLWMGFYENAFHTIKQVYKDLNREPSMPLSTFEQAFKPHDSMTFAEFVNGEWKDWTLHFPTLPGEPGDLILPNSFEFFELWFEWIIKQVTGIDITDEPHTDQDVESDSWFSEILEIIEDKIELFLYKVLKALSRLMIKTLNLWEKIDDPLENTKIAKQLQLAKLKIWGAIGKRLAKTDEGRRAFIIVDLFLTILEGLFEDQAITVQNKQIVIDFQKLNTYDYIEWLKKHGANPELTIPSPLVRAMYDGPFAFLKGDPLQPNVEAGTILRIFLRLAFTCKKHVVWKMQAGMGDTIFAPMYEVLSRRGVKFKFFHKLLNLELNSEKNHIQRIHLAEQVECVKPYEPLIDVAGLPCWPSEPRWEFINPEQAHYLKQNHINLESDWAAWKPFRTFAMEFEKDFDQILLGVSIATLPLVADELIQHSNTWKQMIENVQTVQTQAYQLWFSADANTLGVTNDKLLSTYVEPVDTFAAMNHLLVREQWKPPHEPHYIAYLCGVLDETNPIPPPEQHDFEKNETLRVKQNLLNYIQNHLQHLLPGAFKDHQFQWEYLLDLENQQGEQRLNYQYFRANVSSSERYVLSVKNSSRYRLKTDQTGFLNLFITGDWIQNGLNAGFVEGAVMSGILTFEAIQKVSASNICNEPWCKIN